MRGGDKLEWVLVREIEKIANHRMKYLPNGPPLVGRLEN